MRGHPRRQEVSGGLCHDRTSEGTAQAEVHKFGIIRSELVKLREWLKAEGCTDAVMESTEFYWKTVLNTLEDDPEFELRVVLANPQQVRAVTGHKTDPHDARWLAHLLRHAMIRPSFLPARHCATCGM